MTKQEYLDRLSEKLKVLPASERQDALDYYEGYLSDAGDEAAAISQLGQPGEVAANILADYVTKAPTYAPTIKKDGASGAKTALMIILALFAIPIGLPIAISLAAVAFSLFISLGVIILSFGLTGLGSIIFGIVGIIAFPFAVMQDFGASLMFGGTGLVSIGLGILFIKLTILMTRGFPMIARFVANKISRRQRHDR